MSALSVQCPTCKRKVQWIPDNQFRPFCSQRCREADMGAWASESYRIGNATEADQNELGYDRSDKPGG